MALSSDHLLRNMNVGMRLYPGIPFHLRDGTSSPGTIQVWNRLT